MTTSLYHVVPRDTALRILAEGFWDAGSPWLSRSSESQGVFLTARPLDANDGLPDDWNTVLEVLEVVQNLDVGDWS